MLRGCFRRKPARQQPLPVTTPPVKMRLERSAERDKREIINKFSAEYAQSARGAHSKSSRPVKAVTVCGQVCGGLGGTGVCFRLGGAGDTFVHQRLFQHLGAHRG